SPERRAVSSSMNFFTIRCLAALLVSFGPCIADTVFVEAEAFQCSSSGWTVVSDQSTRQASAGGTLNGAGGPADAVAAITIIIKAAGAHRIWVRHSVSERWHGPLRLA